jgi:hypothetical protein
VIRERTPLDRAIVQLPGWRQPLGAIAPNAGAERARLADALCELAGPEPQTIEELRVALVEDWGDCTAAQVAMAVRELVHAGWLRCEDGGYVARGGDA